MKQRKAAIGLSINFIVILIIAITVFGFSIYFISRIYSGATKTQETYYQQFDNQMESLACDSLDRVCVGKNRKTIGKGNVAVFTMRVVNVDVAYTSGSNNFEIYAYCDTTYHTGGECGSAPVPIYAIPANYLVSSQGIEENEAQSFMIIFENSNNGISGKTYVYNVYVCCDGCNTADPSNCKGYTHKYDDAPQKLYVVVP